MLQSDSFHEMFCKTGTNPEGLTGMILKPSPSVVTAKEDMQQSLRYFFALKEEEYFNLPHIVED